MRNKHTLTLTQSVGLLRRDKWTEAGSFRLTKTVWRGLMKGFHSIVTQLLLGTII